MATASNEIGYDFQSGIKTARVIAVGEPEDHTRFFQDAEYRRSKFSKREDAEEIVANVIQFYQYRGELSLKKIAEKTGITEYQARKIISIAERTKGLEGDFVSRNTLEKLSPELYVAAHSTNWDVLKNEYMKRYNLNNLQVNYIVNHGRSLRGDRNFLGRAGRFALENQVLEGQWIELIRSSQRTMLEAEKDLENRVLELYQDSDLTVNQIVSETGKSQREIYGIVNQAGVVKRSEMLNQGLKYVVAVENGYGTDTFTDVQGIKFNPDRAEQVYIKTKERLEKGDKNLSLRLKAITSHGTSKLCRKIFQKELTDEKLEKDAQIRLSMFNEYINKEEPITMEDKAEILWMFDKAIKESPYVAVKPERTSWVVDGLKYIGSLFKPTNIRSYTRKLADLTSYLV